MRIRVLRFIEKHGRLKEALHKLPPKIYMSGFVYKPGGLLTVVLKFQCPTLEEAAAVRFGFSKLTNHKPWRRGNGNTGWWWKTRETLDNGDRLDIKIYGCKETPASCKPIKKVMTVEEPIMKKVGTQTVEKEVITGWDCGGEAEEDG